MRIAHVLPIIGLIAGSPAAYAGDLWDSLKTQAANQACNPRAMLLTIDKVAPTASNAVKMIALRQMLELYGCIAPAPSPGPAPQPVYIPPPAPTYIPTPVPLPPQETTTCSWIGRFWTCN